MAKGSSSTRRAAREVALRVLYSVDVGRQDNAVDDILTETANSVELDELSRLFASNLVRGTLKNRVEIDTHITRLAVGFPLERQTAVDRNILRLATAEILYNVSDAPAGAVVNEAVELAKKYSTHESGRFVNGVLGGLVRETQGIEIEPYIPEVTETNSMPESDAETEVKEIEQKEPRNDGE